MFNPQLIANLKTIYLFHKHFTVTESGNISIYLSIYTFFFSTVSGLEVVKVAGFILSPESNDVMNLQSDRGNHNSQDAPEITVATGRGKGS